MNFLATIKNFFESYWKEILLLSLALIAATASGFIYLSQQKEKDTVRFDIKSQKTESDLISADIEGAVKKPGVYRFKRGKRIKDLIDLALGFTDDAEIAFFRRNVNLSKLVEDQEKVYIPTKDDISLGRYVENPKTIGSSYQMSEQDGASAGSETVLNINTASIEELDVLPGVGKITAEKIVESRPYSSVEDLLDRKIVKKSVYESIKDLISVQ